MPDRKIQDPIDLDVQEANRQSLQQTLEAAQQLITTKFGPDVQMMRTMGMAFVDSPTRTVIGPRGGKRQVPWDMDSLMEEQNRRNIEEQEEERAYFTGLVEIGLSGQEAFFSVSQSEIRERALNAVKFGRVLNQRYMARELRPRERYDEPDVAGRFDEQTLDRLAGVLIPTTMAPERGSAIVQERIKRTLEARKFNTWARVIPKEERIFLDFLKQVSRRTSLNADLMLDFMERAVIGGQPVYQDDIIEGMKAQVEDIHKKSADISTMTQFDQVFPWIKVTYGPDADFSSLPIIPRKRD